MGDQERIWEQAHPFFWFWPGKVLLEPARHREPPPPHEKLIAWRLLAETETVRENIGI